MGDERENKNREDDERDERDEKNESIDEEGLEKIRATASEVVATPINVKRFKKSESSEVAEGDFGEVLDDNVIEEIEGLEENNGIDESESN